MKKAGSWDWMTLGKPTVYPLKLWGVSSNRFSDSNPIAKAITTNWVRLFSISRDIMGSNSIDKYISMQRRLLPSTLIAATLATFLSWQMPLRGDEITPPPDSNKPATAPTATRGGSNCSSEENPLTAIAPSGTLITTAADYPALLFYIPETTATQGEFAIADGEGNLIYNTKLTLPNEPGIMRLNFSPEAAPPLTETGNPYRWELALICDEFDRAGDDLVGGELQRVEASSEIENKLEGASSGDRFSVFQEAGLGYDAIAALEELRRENPQDLEVRALWENWLRENGLEELVEMAPLGNR